jgi:flagellar biosynthesis component FlhA
MVFSTTSIVLAAQGCGRPSVVATIIFTLPALPGKSMAILPIDSYMESTLYPDRVRERREALLLYLLAE